MNNKDLEAMLSEIRAVNKSQENTMKKINITIDDKSLKELDRQAVAENRTRSAHIR